MGEINIKPITTEIVGINIVSVLVQLNQSCLISGYYIDNNNNRLSNFIVEMSGEEYSQWGDNDEYVINFVLVKLGLQPE